MMAVREHQLLTGVSNNKASQAHALLVWETCAEYERQNLGKLGLDMEKLLMIIPTNRAFIFDKCAAFDNYLLKHDCTRAYDAAFVNHDAGHGGGHKNAWRRTSTRLWSAPRP